MPPLQEPEIIRKSDSKMLSKQAQYSDIESPSEFDSDSQGGDIDDENQRENPAASVNNQEEVAVVVVNNNVPRGSRANSDRRMLRGEQQQQ